ncbi:MAG: hypothetical protein ABIV26_02770 [Candidatus Limnocylindrales bacterium]
MKDPDSTPAVSRITDILPSGTNFMRGLVIGAMVGAAIAGSTIWERRRARSRLRELSAPSASLTDRSNGDEPAA